MQKTGANEGGIVGVWRAVDGVFFFFAAAVFSCAGSPCAAQKPWYQGGGAATQAGPPKAEAVASPVSGYRLSSNDLIHIKVFQEEELETVARVGRDGTIPFPLLGTVGVGGKTLSEATAALILALKEYLVRPQVALRVVEYTKRKFTVLGQVNRPGTFDMPDDAPLSLLEGIGLAGGYTRLANSSRVTVKRSVPGSPEQIFKLDAREMARGKNAPRFQLQPGDTVMVEESLF
jgi:protein involved in polysaccharide export with SLBB domain